MIELFSLFQQSEEEYRMAGLLPPITTRLQVEKFNTTVLEMSGFVEVCVRVISSSVPFTQVPRNVTVDIIPEPGMHYKLIIVSCV